MRVADKLRGEPSRWCIRLPATRSDGEADRTVEREHAGFAAVLLDGPGCEAGGEGDGDEVGGVKGTPAGKRRKPEEGDGEEGGKSGIHVDGLVDALITPPAAKSYTLGWTVALSDERHGVSHAHRQIEKPTPKTPPLVPGRPHFGNGTELAVQLLHRLARNSLECIGQVVRTAAPFQLGFRNDAVRGACSFRRHQLRR